MTALPAPALPLTRTAALLVGFGGAVALRLVVGGPGPGRSPVAGLLFAATLLALAGAARTRVTIRISAVLAGIAGAAILCVPVVIARGAAPLHGAEGFAGWALVVTVVATAEEVFLRGTLYNAVCTSLDERAAILLGAVAFALLHVPLYGWHVLPLDLVVGLLLGELRRSTGTAAAPAVAHVGADLAGWFLR